MIIILRISKDVAQWIFHCKIRCRYSWYWAKCSQIITLVTQSGRILLKLPCRTLDSERLRCYQLVPSIAPTTAAQRVRGSPTSRSRESNCTSSRTSYLPTQWHADPIRSDPKTVQKPQMTVTDTPIRSDPKTDHAPWYRHLGPPNFKKLRKARHRLYRGRLLQVSTCNYRGVQY